MIIYTEGLRSGYEIEQLCRLFYPEKNIITSKEIPENEDEYVNIIVNDGRVEAVLCVEGETLKSDEPIGGCDNLELRFAQVLYGLLTKKTGFTPPWGMLTGVRPIKLLRSFCGKMSEEEALDKLRRDYFVSEEKLRLAKRTYAIETPLLNTSRDDSFSLYISVPFCPTRCAYCSFVSQTIAQAKHLLPDYVDLLVKEIGITAQIAHDLGLKLDTVYMGGGTPTTFSAEQLSRVLTAVGEGFDLSGIREFTVEAGRPDTITMEKLKAIKSAGVGRISINPQTMNDEILRNIGRKHTVAQTVEAFRLAREAGFDDINMDLIAGLYGDTVDGFSKTVDDVIALAPEGITVHTLSMKRASNIVIDGQANYSANNNECAEMLRNADIRLTDAGYKPYYLYRQTRMLGNLENVGWSKTGNEGLYNIYIMDETHTILGVGAGAVTKLCKPHSTYIERVFNYKFPYEYISRFDMLMERKKGVIDFYEKLR